MNIKDKNFLLEALFENVSESIKTSYQSYRQDLRDISSQSDPFSIVWPEKP
jgi:hypothetical protein